MIDVIYVRIHMEDSYIVKNITIVVPFFFVIGAVTHSLSQKRKNKSKQCMCCVFVSTRNVQSKLLDIYLIQGQWGVFITVTTYPQLNEVSGRSAQDLVEPRNAGCLTTSSLTTHAPLPVPQWVRSVHCSICRASVGSRFTEMVISHKRWWAMPASTRTRIGIVYFLGSCK